MAKPPIIPIVGTTKLANEAILKHFSWIDYTTGPKYGLQYKENGVVTDDRFRREKLVLFRSTISDPRVGKDGALPYQARCMIFNDQIEKIIDELGDADCGVNYDIVIRFYRKDLRTTAPVYEFNPLVSFKIPDVDSTTAGKSARVAGQIKISKTSKTVNGTYYTFPSPNGWLTGVLQMVDPTFEIATNTHPAVADGTTPNANTLYYETDTSMMAHLDEGVGQIIGSLGDYAMYVPTDAAQESFDPNIEYWETDRLAQVSHGMIPDPAVLYWKLSPNGRFRIAENAGHPVNFSNGVYFYEESNPSPYNRVLVKTDTSSGKPDPNKIYFTPRKFRLACVRDGHPANFYEALNFENDQSYNQDGSSATNELYVLETNTSGGRIYTYITGHDSEGYTATPDPNKQYYTRRIYRSADGSAAYRYVPLYGTPGHPKFFTSGVKYFTSVTDNFTGTSTLNQGHAYGMFALTPSGIRRYVPAGHAHTGHPDPDRFDFGAVTLFYKKEDGSYVETGYAYEDETYYIDVGTTTPSYVLAPDYLTGIPTAIVSGVKYVLPKKDYLYFDKDHRYSFDLETHLELLDEPPDYNNEKWLMMFDPTEQYYRVPIDVVQTYMTDSGIFGTSDTTLSWLEKKYLEDDGLSLRYWHSFVNTHRDVAVEISVVRHVDIAKIASMTDHQTSVLRSSGVDRSVTYSGFDQPPREPPLSDNILGYGSAGVSADWTDNRARSVFTVSPLIDSGSNRYHEFFIQRPDLFSPIDHILINQNVGLYSGFRLAMGLNLLQSRFIKPGYSIACCTIDNERFDYPFPNTSVGTLFGTTNRTHYIYPKYVPDIRLHFDNTYVSENLPADRVVALNSVLAASGSTAPTRSGYAFGGWYTEQDGRGVKVFDNTGTCVLNADKQLTYNELVRCKWMPFEHDYEVMMLPSPHVCNLYAYWYIASPSVSSFLGVDNTSDDYEYLRRSLARFDLPATISSNGAITLGTGLRWSGRNIIDERNPNNVKFFTFDEDMKSWINETDIIYLENNVRFVSGTDIRSYKITYPYDEYSLTRGYITSSGKLLYDYTGKRTPVIYDGYEGFSPQWIRPSLSEIGIAALPSVFATYGITADENGRIIFPPEVYQPYGSPSGYRHLPYKWKGMDLVISNSVTLKWNGTTWTSSTTTLPTIATTGGIGNTLVNRCFTYAYYSGRQDPFDAMIPSRYEWYLPFLTVDNSGNVVLNTGWSSNSSSSAQLVFTDVDKKSFTFSFDTTKQDPEYQDSEVRGLYTSSINCYFVDREYGGSVKTISNNASLRVYLRDSTYLTTASAISLTPHTYTGKVCMGYYDERTGDTIFYRQDGDPSKPMIQTVPLRFEYENTEDGVRVRKNYILVADWTDA